MATKKIKPDEIAAAARAVYLITASIDYALGELLAARTKNARQPFLKRLGEDAKHLERNVKMLEKVVDRQP